MSKGREYTPEFKASVVLEIITGEKTVAQASRDYDINDSLLRRWKAQFLEGARQGFIQDQSPEEKRQTEQMAKLERQVDKLKLQLEIAEKAEQYLKSPPSESAI